MSEGVAYNTNPTDDEEQIPEYEGETLYERLGSVYGIAGAVDDLVDRLYINDTVNQNPAVKEFHETYGKAGFKYLVTAWSIEYAGGPAVYPGRGMAEAHKELEVTELEFDVIRTEIKTSLCQLGVPEPELREFMGIIDTFREAVVADQHRDETWDPP